jgi:3-hydroxy-5-methyl-1-naphthoate 3-O-methyltransferase
MEGKDKITPEKIRKITHGMWIFRTLHAAVELELFTKIAEGKTTINEIAEGLGVKERPIEKLLNACVALEFLVKEGESYGNSQVAGEFLVKGKPNYFGDMVVMFGSKDSFKDLKKAIETDAPVTESLDKRMENKEHAEIFTKAMHNNAMGPAIVLSEKFDFSKFNKLLDVGGGSGAFSIVLTREHSNLKASVFDLPNTCSVADQYIHEADASEKVSCLEGDFFKDELPKGYDVFLLSQIMHSWSVKENKILLKKIYDSLPENGVLIINEFLLNEEKTGPLHPALFSLNMLVQSDGGSAYTESEIKGMLEEVGFEYQETIKLGGPVTAIVSRKD